MEAIPHPQGTGTGNARRLNTRGKVTWKRQHVSTRCVKVELLKQPRRSAQSRVSCVCSSSSSGGGGRRSGCQTDTLIHCTSTNFATHSVPKGDGGAHGRVSSASIYRSEPEAGRNATNTQTYSPAASTPPGTVRLRSSPCRELSEVLERCCTWVEHPFSLEL